MVDEHVHFVYSRSRCSGAFILGFDYSRGHTPLHVCFPNTHPCCITKAPAFYAIHAQGTAGHGHYLLSLVLIFSPHFTQRRPGPRPHSIKYHYSNIYYCTNHLGALQTLFKRPGRDTSAGKGINAINCQSWFFAFADQSSFSVQCTEQYLRYGHYGKCRTDQRRNRKTIRHDAFYVAGKHAGKNCPFTWSSVPE